MPASRPTVPDPEADSVGLPAQVLCAWCGLPAVGSWFPVRRKPLPESIRQYSAGAPVRVAPQQQPVYCCYGCRVAHEITQETGDAGAIRWTILRLGLSVFFTMNLMAFTMTMWSLDVYDVDPDPFQLKLFEVFRWLSLLLAFPVLLLLGVPLLQNALESLSRRVYSTDLLIVTGVAAAYVTSVATVLQGGTSVYFEVGAMVLVAVTLGRWFEATGKQKATEALDTMAALLPESALRVDAGVECRVDSRSIVAGDQLRIGAGECFPTDAVLVSGRTTVDEQVFTGESTPIEREPGDPLLAGTVNLDGDVLVRATAGFRCGSFGRLLQLLQEARIARGHYQRLADRISAWFLPVVTVISGLTFFWYLPTGISGAVQNSLSVLLIACPCALGLATPLAIWTALSAAFRRQILFRSGEAIERLAAANVICLDKTGTLTTGAPQVVRTVWLCEAGVIERVRELLTELTGASRHPYSRAIFDQIVFESDRSGHGRPESVFRTWRRQCSAVRTIAGRGIEADLNDGRVARIGSPEFVRGVFTTETGLSATNTGISPEEGCLQPGDDCERLSELSAEADRLGAAFVVMSIHGAPQVAWLLTETLRAETVPALDELQRLGFSVTVLTGDREARAEHLRDELQRLSSAGIRLLVRSGLKPSDKVAAIQAIQRDGGRVIMVGDGINDAPALACSDVGVALGCGADVSRDSAQLCLLGNDLGRLPWAIQLARRTRHVIRRNLFWAFGYNAAGVGLAAAGLLNPAAAAGLMIVSSLLVITNSLKLITFRAEIGPETRASGDAEPPAVARITAASPRHSHLLAPAAGAPGESDG